RLAHPRHAPRSKLPAAGGCPRIELCRTGQGVIAMRLDPLSSLLAALAVLLGGTLLNPPVGLRARYNLPDPITGLILVPAVASAAATAGWQVEIDPTIKPVLLLLFFAGIGMGADLRLLKRGGKALVLFLIVLFPYILLQNAVGVAAASLLDLHPI